MIWMNENIPLKYTLENTEGTIKNGQYRETSSIGRTRGRKTKQKHNTMCVGHHYTQTNSNNVSKSPPTNN